MENQILTSTLLVDQTPKEAFDAVLNVRGWWTGLFSEEIEGNVDILNDEFTFRAGEGAHYSKQKLIELIPNEKVVWLVTDSKLTFLKDEGEWNGTKIRFEISKQGDKTAVIFTHLGLNPKMECFESIRDAWNQYLQQCLLSLITNGKAELAHK